MFLRCATISNEANCVGCNEWCAGRPTLHMLSSSKRVSLEYATVTTSTEYATRICHQNRPPEHATRKWHQLQYEWWASTPPDTCCVHPTVSPAAISLKTNFTRYQGSNHTQSWPRNKAPLKMLKLFEVVFRNV